MCSLFFTEATGETAFVPPAMKVGLYFVFCKLSMVAAGQFQPTAARPDVVCVYLQAYLWCAGAPEVGVIVKKFFFFLSGAACIAELSQCEHHHLQSIFLSCSYKLGIGGLNEARGALGMEGRGVALPRAGSQELTSKIMFSVVLTWSRDGGDNDCLVERRWRGRGAAIE